MSELINNNKSCPSQSAREKIHRKMKDKIKMVESWNQNHNTLLHIALHCFCKWKTLVHLKMTNMVRLDKADTANWCAVVYFDYEWLPVRWAAIVFPIYIVLYIHIYILQAHSLFVYGMTMPMTMQTQTPSHKSAKISRMKMNFKFELPRKKCSSTKAHKI